MSQKPKKNEPEFWIVNVSKRDVHLFDIGVIIPSRKSINLLNKHYYITEDQIKKSLSSGSLKKKSSMVKVRKFPPQREKMMLQVAVDSAAGRVKQREQVEMHETRFEEFEIDGDSDLIEEEFAELEFIDRAPRLSVDPKYDKSE